MRGGKGREREGRGGRREAGGRKREEGRGRRKEGGRVGRGDGTEECEWGRKEGDREEEVEVGGRSVTAFLKCDYYEFDRASIFLSRIGKSTNHLTATTTKKTSKQGQQKKAKLTHANTLLPPRYRTRETADEVEQAE